VRRLVRAYMYTHCPLLSRVFQYDVNTGYETALIGKPVHVHVTEQYYRRIITSDKLLSTFTTVLVLNKLKK